MYFIILFSLLLALFSARALFLLFHCTRLTNRHGYVDQFTSSPYFNPVLVSVKSCRYRPTFFVPAIYEEVEFLCAGVEYKIRVEEMYDDAGKRDLPLHVRLAFWDICRRWKNKTVNYPPLKEGLVRAEALPVSSGRD